ncbi:MAG TPA: hypothetical protein VHI78_09430 [Bacteroidales bacterium]|jgi:hypothetical protein|nr:hypothetical protein [Bacteroidales bacterium]
MSKRILMESIKQSGIKLFAITMVLAIVMPFPVAGGNNDDKSIRLNPEFKINRNSNGTVTVTSRNPEESNVRHEFSDFYADLIMGAYRKQSLNTITDTLRKKYYLSEDECRRELKHALNTLYEWRIILRDDLALQ